MKKQHKRVGKRLLSLALALVLALGTFGGLGTATASASNTKVGGTAPFMNTWLVAGPSETSEVKNIYGQAPLERPANGNWARIASVEASSTWQTNAYDYPHDSPSPKQVATMAIDGDLNTCWLSQMHDTGGDPSTWPVWDPKPTYTLTWSQPIKVQEVHIYNRYDASWGTQDISQLDRVDVTLLDADGEPLTDTVSVTEFDHCVTNLGVARWETAVEGVTTVKLEIMHNGEKTLHNVGLGFSEVEVYDGDPIEEPAWTEPEDGNWAALATATANSEYNSTYAASKAIDGDKGTAWASRGTDPGEKVLTLTWESPIPVDKVVAWSRENGNGYDLINAVTCVLFDADGKELGRTVTGDPTPSDPCEAVFETTVTNVSKMELRLGDSTDNAGFLEVEVYGSLPVEKLAIDGVQVSTVLNNDTTNYGGDKAFDGDFTTAWKSNCQQGWVWDAAKNNAPLMTLTLEEPSQVTEIRIKGFEKDGKDLFGDYELKDADGVTVASGRIQSIRTEGDTLVVENVANAYNVTTIELQPVQLTDKGGTPDSAPNHLGFTEVEIYGVPGETEEVPDEEPAIQITPKLGETLGENEWKYFDDRVFNRNKDDYNDLMGFFDVKRGEETEGNYVAAAVYVYSEEAQTVKWQFAGSGKYTLYCNDKQVGTQDTVPGDVQKEGTKYSIRLKAGWNKLLVDIQHVNPSVACNLMGFYSRLCDANGNLVEGLTYSVIGPNTVTGGLEVATQGMDFGTKEAFEERNADCTANEFPENTLPIAYEKNPYVSLTTTGGSNSGQASKFQLQAAGGQPGYTWELVGGALPENLTLNADGTITGTPVAGAANSSSKDYTFTVKVTDAAGSTAEKTFTMTVKPHPAQWFEEGRMAALSHCTGTIPNLYDPNFNYDEWAQTAKEMGMTMLSSESYQNSIYYWPSPNANLTPSDSNAQYKYGALEQDENGNWQVVDRLMQAKEAAERYGLHFGTYTSPQRPQSDMQGLVERYDPWYIFLDGNPQTGVNLDIAFSSVRNYNDRVLIQTNPNKEMGDQDLTLMERPYWFSQAYNDGWSGNININTNPEGNYLVHEQWNDPFTSALDLWKIWSGEGKMMRDQWPEAVKEIVDAIGHGYVMNHDSSIAVSRGCDNLIWGSAQSSLDPDNIYAMVPVSSQQLSTFRNSIGEWMQNEGKPSLYESLFGTMPYYIDYTPKEGWHEEGTQLATFYGEGPEWGYAVSRDQYVYLHLVESPIANGRDKTGFTGQDTLSNIGPFDYEVTSVSWLNEGKTLSFTQTQQDGKYYIEIDTSAVVADPVDTIIKIETKDPTRNYQLTGIHVYSSQETGEALQLRTECYMNEYTSVLAPADVTYASGNTAVASVNADGTVTPVADGETEITVTAVYDGVTKTDTYPVKVSGGQVSPDLELVGVGLFTEGNTFWDEVFAGTSVPVAFQGYTAYGGTVDLLDGVNVSNITYHYAAVDGSTSRQSIDNLISIVEVDASEVPFHVENGQLKLDFTQEADKYYCYWAEITVDGKTFTTSRNFLTFVTDRNLVEGVVPEVTSGDAEALSDGVINDKTGGNLVRWTADADDAAPSITYDLGSTQELTRINLYYNWGVPRTNAVTYINAPEQIKIEYSLDGETWTEGNLITEQTGSAQPLPSTSSQYLPTNNQSVYAWENENVCYNYKVDASQNTVEARYVRISFPAGGQGSDPIDLLEIRIYGFAEEMVYEPSSEKDILSFAIEGGKTEINGTEITVTMPARTDVTALTPTITVSDKASVSPASGEAKDFTAPVTYTVTAEDGTTKIYTVTVVVSVDKTALEALVADAKALNEEDYTEETWSDLEAALTAAETVLADEDATQADVDNAYNALDAAMEALETKPVVPPVDKSALEALVEEAEALNEDDYTEETWSGLEAALAAAEAVLADEEATQEDVDQTLEALQAAIDGLREKPEPEPEPEVDKSALEALYNDNKDRQQGNYTKPSWDAFQEALENAKAVLDDANASQEEVDAAEAALRDAIDGLQKPTYPVLPVVPGGSNTTKPANEMPFTDVNTGDWFYNDVKYVYENGIMNGVSDTRFAPQSTLTRAMVVTILYRMEDEPSTRYNALFPDVTDNQWYTKGVEWAANNGIVLGYTSGKFGPNDPVTREQLAAILYRYAQSKNYVLAEGSDLSAFTDASNISPYAVTAVQWSVTESLLEGSNGKLLPRQNATRAEVAHAIAGFCQNVGK